MFERVLIANRGEIALRVMRTAREMGVETIAVYSDFDKRSLHTRFADRAVALGGTLPAESYLDIDKVLDAARRTGAQAIHPGYGFLAENPLFAERVVEAGLVWIGPPPDVIRDMGDKITSRRLMREAGLPIVPGLVDPVDDPDAAVSAAEEIGYPVALKAAAGGGGKGIRVVHAPAEMESAFRAASGEARGAFGDGRLYLERYPERPRHVEIQVLFDHHGAGVHLGERECSIQRRHQKLIEESPSPVVDAELRDRMGAAALTAARAVGYQNAGTVEFLLSGSRSSDAGEFFFLEMNTRLQVEHPVTEMVTGIDLVREQLRVAAGEPLGYGQEAVTFQGHSIEVRVNAEDPSNGFLPSTGTIKNLRLPGGPWVRVDSALFRGMEVGVSYDPMLAKVIVWAHDRAGAIERMRRTLQELNVGGVRTGVPAALAVLEHEGFQSGDFDTQFLESMDLSARADPGGPGGQGGRVGEASAAAVAATIHRWTGARRRSLAGGTADREAWWRRGLPSYGGHGGREGERR
ncbi:MAG: acetyl-CoA carboxylase biotin carboxylase subunit [Planctomycetota bacterium]|nr:acetyl-CoA carboxylase biotin carboxylase subunit [Planctomycetota bacterium]